MYVRGLRARVMGGRARVHARGCANVCGQETRKKEREGWREREMCVGVRMSARERIRTRAR